MLRTPPRSMRTRALEGPWPGRRPSGGRRTRRRDPRRGLANARRSRWPLSWARTSPRARSSVFEALRGPRVGQGVEVADRVLGVGRGPPPLFDQIVVGPIAGGGDDVERRGAESRVHVAAFPESFGVGVHDVPAVLMSPSFPATPSTTVRMPPRVPPSPDPTCRLRRSPRWHRNGEGGDVLRQAGRGRRRPTLRADGARGRPGRSGATPTGRSARQATRAEQLLDLRGEGAAKAAPPTCRRRARTARAVWSRGSTASAVRKKTRGQL